MEQLRDQRFTPNQTSEDARVAELYEQFHRDYAAYLTEINTKNGTIPEASRLYDADWRVIDAMPAASADSITDLAAKAWMAKNTAS